MKPWVADVGPFLEPLKGPGHLKATLWFLILPKGKGEVGGKVFVQNVNIVSPRKLAETRPIVIIPCSM